MSKSKSVKKSIIAMLLCFLTAGAIIAGCAIKDLKKGHVEEKPGPVQEITPTTVPSEAGRIQSIESKTLSGQVDISFQSDQKIQYSAFRLTDPERLVLEFSNTAPGDYQNPIIIDQGIVRKLTPIYFSETNITRIEIALDQPTEYNIDKADDNLVTVEIKNKPDKAAKSISETMKEVSMAPDQGFEDQAMDSEDTLSEIGTLETIADRQDKTGEESFIYGEKTKQPYNGQNISLDFQSADVKNILRILAEVSGLNIITTPEVTGNVTMRLINVPWDQALDIVLKNNKLGMEKEGNIIRIATLDQLKSEKEAKLNAKQKLLEEKSARTKAAPLITETVQISYADIIKLQQNLEGLKSERGNISIDERTFTIIMVDIKDNIEKMKSLITALDKQTKQVSIEARIVEVSRNYTKELGVQWGGNVSTTTNYGFPNTIGVSGGGFGTNSGSGNYVVDLPAAAGAGSGGILGLMLGNISGTQFLDIQLSALETAGKARILSNPRITTKDNTEAIIESGKDIPFETTSLTGTKTEWKKATIKLKTTPHITPDGYISLKIEAAKDEPDTSLLSAGGVPTITTRNMISEVLVKDGDTAVLGGLFKKNNSDTKGGVPWLSDVPGLGWLFKKKLNKDDEEELLIFITPKILKGAGEVL